MQTPAFGQPSSIRGTWCSMAPEQAAGPAAALQESAIVANLAGALVEEHTGWTVIY